MVKNDYNKNPIDPTESKWWNNQLWLLCLLEEKLSRFNSELKLVFGFRDLGAHIDGFIAVVAHTIVVGAAPDKKITGKLKLNLLNLT